MSCLIVSGQSVIANRAFQVIVSSRSCWVCTAVVNRFDISMPIYAFPIVRVFIVIRVLVAEICVWPPGNSVPKARIRTPNVSHWAPSCPVEYVHARLIFNGLQIQLIYPVKSAESVRRYSNLLSSIIGISLTSRVPVFLNLSGSDISKPLPRQDLNPFEQWYSTPNIMLMVCKVRAGKCIGFGKFRKCVIREL